MSIQKLLPARLPSGYSVNANNYYYYATILNNDFLLHICPGGAYQGSNNLGVYHNGGFSLYSGSNISDYSTQFTNHSAIDYLAKSVSNPDDSSYVGIYSGVFYPDTKVDSFNSYLTYELCSLKPRGFTTRFRYSGLASFEPIVNISYDIYNPGKTGVIAMDNYYSTIGVLSGVTPSYTGNSQSEFVTFQTPSINYGDTSWFIDIDLLDNLIMSGSHIRSRLSFAASGSLRTYDSSPRFSAMEIEVSGIFPGKSTDMYLCSNIPVEVTKDGPQLYLHSPIPQQSGGIEFYTKRHGYINSIEEIVVSGGVSHLYPTNGTYADNSGALFYFFPTDNTTYKIATGYSSTGTELIVPSYYDNPMTRYLRKSIDRLSSTYILIPSANHTYSNGFIQYSGGTFNYDVVNDNNDSTYIRLNQDNAYITLPLTDTPVDTENITNISITFRTSRGSKGDYAPLDYLQILKSDGVTPITSTVTGATSSAITTYVFTPSNIYYSDKSSWDGALLKIKQGLGNGTGISIYEVYVTITYSASSYESSYIGLTEPVLSQSGYANSLYLGVGTQLDTLPSVPKSLTTRIAYSGSLNPLDYNLSNLNSEYYLNLNGQSYYVGKGCYSSVWQLDGSASSFQKLSFPTLYFDGTPQPSPDNRLYISGNLMNNLLNSGATFSTYTTLTVLETYNSGTYSNHAISAFEIEASGVDYIEYIPHPSLHMLGSTYTNSGIPLSLPNVAIRNSGNFTMYTKSNTLDEYFPMNIEGSWPSGILNLYIANNLQWSQANKNITFYIDNHSGTAIDNNVNMHIGSRYSNSGILNMYMPVPLIGNTNNTVNFHTNGRGTFDKSVDFYTMAPLVGYDSGSINMLLGGIGISKEYGINLSMPSDYGSGINSINLMVENRNISSGSINLYTAGDGYGKVSGSINMILPVNAPVETVPLYIHNNLEYTTESVSLYTTSYIVNSGSVNMYIPVRNDGYHSGDINVYLRAEAPYLNLDFFLKQETAYVNKDVTLFTPSYIVDSGTVPLYINGGGIALNSGNLEMFIRSAIQKSGDVNMSIMGNLAFGNIDFTIYYKDVDRLNSKTDFFVNSADKSGLINSFDMYVKSVNYTADIPFYIPTSSTGNTSGELAFYMLNDTTKNKDVLFCIYNNLKTKEAGYTLFTQGDGLTNGGKVARSSMNLFINRGNESIDNSVQMIVNGPSGEINNVPFYLNGGYITEKDIVLTMPNVNGPNSGNVEMYVHGF